MKAIKAAISIHVMNWKQKRNEPPLTDRYRYLTSKESFGFSQSALFPRVPVSDGNWINLEDRAELTTIDMYKKVLYWKEMKENLRSMRTHKL